MDIGRVVLEIGEAEAIPRHIHDGLEIFYLLKGAAVYEADGRSFVMGPEDIVVSGSGIVHAISGDSPNIAFRIFVGDDFLEKETGSPGVRVTANSMTDGGANDLLYYELKRVVAQLMLTHSLPGRWQALEEKTALLKVIAHLVTNFQSAAAEAGEPELDGRIQTVKKIIHSGYKSDLSLKEVAARQHISVHYLSRLFKKQTGVGFYSYLNKVRMNAAVMEILHTKEPILKIALRNGFSNVASFNRVFIDLYGQSPAKYRAARQMTGQPQTRAAELLNRSGERGDLIKYLRSYDLKSPAGSGLREELVLDLASEPMGSFQVLRRVVRVGRLGELLKAEVRRQLRLLRKEISFDTVQAIFLRHDGLYAYKSAVYADYEYFQVFDFLMAGGLKPMLEINLEDIADEPAGEGQVEVLAVRLESFLNKAAERYGLAELGQWRFELCLNWNLPQWPDFIYGRLVGVIRTVLAQARIGLRFIDQEAALTEKAAEFLSFFARWTKKGQKPDFVTYCLRHNVGGELMQDGDYSRYRHYNAKRLEAFTAVCPEAGLESGDVILLEWNTLSGFKAAESNTFYRSALFLDEAFALNTRAAEVGVWLSTYVHEAASGRDHFDAPAFFLFGILKRPLYFAAKLLDMLGGQIICRTERVFAVKNSGTEYTVLIYNPAYFNPEYASDRIFAENQSRIFTLDLHGLSGDYIFERCHMDQGQSALYDRWANMGFPPMLDNNVVAQLDKTVNMDYSIFEEIIEGSYKINFKLKFNEAVVFKIKKRVN